MSWLTKRFSDLTMNIVIAMLSLVFSVSGSLAASRITMVVPLDEESSWRDFAFLAAVPAVHYASKGVPSVIALDDHGFTPEVDDYLKRYRPDTLYSLGETQPDLQSAGKKCEVLNAASADVAAAMLSRRAWSESGTTVICSDGDYASALVASALAARLRVPLLFVNSDGVPDTTSKELQRLKTGMVVAVGKSSGHGALSLKQSGRDVVGLKDASAVLRWVRSQGLSVNYITALNPTDRDKTVIRKISLAGVLLAAGRDGLVIPLSYETRWKVPFTGRAVDEARPAGDAKPDEVTKRGWIAFEGEPKHEFIVTGNEKKQAMQLRIDLEGDGVLSTPLYTGDTVQLDGREYAVTLGEKNGAGKADLRLSWPTAEQLCRDLKKYYQLMERPPLYLCLAGFPDAIPQALVRKKPLSKDLTSDAPFANADEDEFVEMGVSRVVAENVSFATLYASRVLTYNSLLDSAWQSRACQGDWENTYGDLFANAGFDSSYRHTENALKWIVPPAGADKGKREKSFDQSSPLAGCAVLAHMHHSWWHGLGSTYQWDSEVLLAPVVVESGGCLTAALDFESDCRTVIARLFRKGAVSFSGNSREGIAQSEQQRHEFWNGVLSGQSIGIAHRDSMNSALVTMKDLKQERDGGFWYQLNIRTQFGDPAFVMHLPSKPKVKPACVTVKGDVVSVHAPEKWWPVKMYVPPDWKEWADKELYVLRGPGVYARRRWCGEGFDLEETYMTASFTTHRTVTGIEQVQKPQEPLGWNGKYYEDLNADGTRTYRWSVRMADFDQKTGKIIKAVEHLDYSVSYR